jgi:hypothetical protein
MRTLLNIVSKMKWLGLLGLPMLFSDWYVWKMLWMFWLFGIAEILMTLPVFVQSLRQIVGITIANIKNKPMPDKDNFIPKVKYSLPFHEAWVAVNGGVTKEFSHSWGINSQRYAYDFIILDNEGKSCSGDRAALSGYYCYGKEISAPANGVVAEVRTDCRDSKIMGGGKTDPLVKDIRGNYVVIQHAENEYSFLAHLMPGSISVGVGEQVKRTQQIALCGNSGNTSEPHLHFQIQNGKNFFNSAGLPIHFERIEAAPQAQYSAYDSRPIPMEIDEADFVSRGQCVKNK